MNSGNTWPALMVMIGLQGSTSNGSKAAFCGIGGGAKKREDIMSSHSSPKIELMRDADVGGDVLRNFGEADWWNWSGGSTLIFWRWPEGPQRKAARDGMAPWILGELPNFKRRAKAPPPKDRSMMWSKFEKFLHRRYVRLKRTILSFTEYFHVPKGDDIRMVFNGTSCSLNRAAWAPNFWLPTSRTATSVLDFDYKTVDIDLGEMFVNFPLAEIYQQFSGIDLAPFKPEVNELKKASAPSKLTRSDKWDSSYWGRCWERCWMGLRPSPFYAIRILLLG